METLLLVAAPAAQHAAAGRTDPINLLYIFILAGFVGFSIITRVPPLLHSPLMSATNAVSAISVVGSVCCRLSHPPPAVIEAPRAGQGPPMPSPGQRSRPCWSSDTYDNRPSYGAIFGFPTA